MFRLLHPRRQEFARAMEATRFAAEVSRLQAELAPTPPWSWVARGLAAALTGFESGGLTDPILLCDLQRQWQGGKAARQAAAKDDVVRALMEERRVEWGRPLEVEVRSIETSRQLIWVTAPGAAEAAPALPHLPDERLMRLCREGAVGPQRRLLLVGCTVAEVEGSLHLLPTPLFALFLDAGQPGDRAVAERASRDAAQLRSTGVPSVDGSAPRLAWLQLRAVPPAAPEEWHHDHQLRRVQVSSRCRRRYRRSRRRSRHRRNVLVVLVAVFVVVMAEVAVGSSSEW